MTALSVLAVVAGVIGIVGSIVPGLPGPPVSWIGLLLAWLSHGTDASGHEMGVACLVVWLAVMVVVTVLDYVIPAKFTKVTGGSSAAAKGSLIGLFAGMFIPPVGMIAGSLIGAFAAEFLFKRKGAWPSLKSAMGAFLGFVFGTGLKLLASAMMMYYIVVYSF